MGRALNTYTLREILHGRPLLFAKRTAAFRLRMMGGLYRARRPQRIAAPSGRAVITIAFNRPREIEIQLRLVKRFLPSDIVHVIADNSTHSEAAELIRETAQRFDVPYIKLPSSPFGRHPNHSHAFALNWCWQNIVRPSQFRLVGFLDHDLFPVDHNDPFRHVQTSPVGGVIWDGVYKPKWHLWAGFCFFDRDRLSSDRLDFRDDFYSGLDTGGGNWRLYRSLERSAVSSETMVNDVVDETIHIQRIGSSWIHLASASYAADADIKLKWIESAYPFPGPAVVA